MRRALSCTLTLVTAVTLLPLSFAAAANDRLQQGIDAYLNADYGKAFAILSPLATPSNPQLQNLVGLMFYEGRGVATNAAVAHLLFHEAAAAGVRDAGRNLGILHSIGAPGIAVDYAEARKWFNAAAGGGHSSAAADGAGTSHIPTTVETVIDANLHPDSKGQRTYLTFCAGCHGFSGMRFFPDAPSFAMGDRMTKSTAELMQSILKGKGLMPSWEDKLPVAELEDALGYLRQLAWRTGYGTDTRAYDVPPERFYIFSPMGTGELFQQHWRVDKTTSGNTPTGSDRNDDERLN